MKFIVIVIIFIYWKSVDGSNISLRNLTLIVEPLDQDEEGSFLMAGDSKKISCKASSWTNRRVEWYSPTGELVRHQPGSRVSVQEHFIPVSRTKARTPTHVLTISRASVEDSGVWECRYGTLADVAKYPLCVIDPTEFVDTPSNVSLDEGRSISLTCQTRGNPEPRMVWYKDGVEIYEDLELKKYTIGVKYSSQLMESFLTVKAVGPDDSGVYTCEAHQDNPLLNGCGTTISHNISLEVNYAPYFDDDEENVYLFSKNNESINLECPANGYPQPTYKWFQVLDDGALLELPKKPLTVPGDGTQSNMSVVTNGKLWETYGYRYKCQANNRYGESTRHFTLLKLQKPTEPQLIYTHVSNVTDNRVHFNISWNYVEYAFPVDAYEIEYQPSALTSGEQLIFIYLEPRVIINDMVKSMTISLQLEPQTQYSVRINLQNEAGATPWSKRFYVETKSRIDDIHDETHDKTHDKVTTKHNSQQLTIEEEPLFSKGVIAGIILTAAIIAFAASCITVIKKL